MLEFLIRDNNLLSFSNRATGMGAFVKHLSMEI